jgi:Mycothiol maleylpyruvate isomerase N-terminal domain
MRGSGTVAPISGVTSSPEVTFRWSVCAGPWSPFSERSFRCCHLDLRASNEATRDNGGMADERERLVTNSRLGVDRLTASLNKLAPTELSAPLPNGWTVSITLAHLAFWDQWVVARWKRFLKIGSFEDIDDSVMDLVNDAALPAWTSLMPQETVKMAVASARQAVATVTNLPDDAQAAAIDTGRNTMLDRTLHWDPHLQEINKAVCAMA